MARPFTTVRSLPSRNAASTPSSDGTGSEMQFEETYPSVIKIATNGDLLLRIEHESDRSTITNFFLVDSTILKRNSKYFERALSPGRFSESLDIEGKNKCLLERYDTLAEVPMEALPRLDIKDVGRISPVKALDALLTDFLSLMHEKDVKFAFQAINFANLAIVADRFDALETVKSYVHRKKLLIGIENRTTPGKVDANLSEDKVRQRLLIAILLDFPFWLDRYSHRLVMKGWVGMERNTSGALWWDLPSQVEEEIACRREYVLETIQSLQSHFLALYTSRERQCKMGYDNSAQCDSFQLGEMIRFFTRIGTLHLQGTIASSDEESQLPCQDDLTTLLDTLRQVPEYQIDRFHTHCGIRTKIIPLIDAIQLSHLGICAECWASNRKESSWLEAKRPLVWSKQDLPLKGRPIGHRHYLVRDIFMASERCWS